MLQQSRNVLHLESTPNKLKSGAPKRKNYFSFGKLSYYSPITAGFTTKQQQMTPQNPVQQNMPSGMHSGPHPLKNSSACHRYQETNTQAHMRRHNLNSLLSVDLRRGNIWHNSSSIYSCSSGSKQWPQEPRRRSNIPPPHTFTRCQNADVASINKY